MSRKKKILILVDWYLPGYKAGGPIQSVANLVGHLKDEFEFSIITSDRDLHSTQAYSGIHADEWNFRPDGSKVYYFSPENMKYSKLKQLILAEQADVLYLNSMFSVFFTLFPLWIRKKCMPTRKLVLAPRGMLGKGALAIKSGKKKTFLTLAKISGLYRGIRWQASSEAEAEEIKKQFGKQARVLVALNLSAPRELKPVTKVKAKGQLKLAFLNRISSKKNLEGTLKLLARLPEGNQVEFDVYGPIEDKAYFARCEELIKHMPSHIRCRYTGMVPNAAVVEKLQGYHFGILLTFHENFGHSIVESFAAGCPMILSDQTPWKHLQVGKAGWEIPLAEEDRIIEALKAACAMDQEQYNQWSKGALEMAKRIIFHPEALDQNKKLFD